MRKTGRTKALLAMFLAAASLQAGTALVHRQQPGHSCRREPG